MGSMSRKDALKLIKGSSRHTHSLLVSRVMVILARRLGGDEGEWELVGLLHDIDYDSVQGDMAQHGVKAAESLTGKISEEGLDAIMSHDHRTGLKSQGPLAESLRFADAMVVLMDDQELRGPIKEAALESTVRLESSQKPWIGDILEAFTQEYGIQLSEVLKELGEL